MSMKKKRAGLVITWQRSISILAPWRKGKGVRETVVEREVVLTKMKFISNPNEKRSASGNSTSTNSTVPTSEHLSPAPLDDKSPKPRADSGSDFLPSGFTNSRPPRLYKFESEDSGVDLPSGANSPSTPMGSEQSFVVHSRESSCHSCNLNSDATILAEELVQHAQNTDAQPADESQDSISEHSQELCSSAMTVEPHIEEDVDVEQFQASGSVPEGHEEASEQLKDDRTLTEAEKSFAEHSLSGTRDDVTGSEPDPKRSSTTSEGLEEYMEQCCRLSESQQTGSGPQGSGRGSGLGSGLGYLQHICQLLEKIGHLQETNLKLQRQICSLQKDGRMAKTKEEFFHQHCSCGAASLIFQPALKKQSRSEFLSPSGTLSDLSTIPEVTHNHHTPNTDLRSESLWRRGLNRRSYTEGEVRFLGDSTDGLSSLPQRRFSENYTWGRVKDLVRRAKLRNQNRLGLSSSSLKMSCPQLYRPDLGSVEPTIRNRNSMIVLGHQSKVDFPWLP